jgi:hypothetical protein
LSRARHIAHACLLVVPWNALALAYGRVAPKSDKHPAEQPGQEAQSNYRVSLTIGSPRKYATRYIIDKRALEVRIHPAKASEFTNTEHYDSRYIHRLIIREHADEVVLSFQLKNNDIEWLVTHKEQPWRIIIDFWESAPKSASFDPAADTTWNWAGLNSSELGQLQSSPHAQYDSFDGTGDVQALDLPIDGTIAASQPQDNERVNSWEPEIQQQLQKGNYLGSDHPLQSERADSLENEPGFGSEKDMGRFLRTRPQPDPTSDSQTDLSAKELARQAFNAGAHNSAFSQIRREASLRRREFLSDPEAIWLGGESAYLSGRTEVARDYFLTLTAIPEVSSYTALAQLRLTDLDVLENRTPAQDSTERYTALAQNEQLPWIPRIVAVYRLLQAAEKPNVFIGEQFLPVIQACMSSQEITPKIQQECIYQNFLHKVSTDDLLTAQDTIEAIASQQPDNPRIAVHEAGLKRRIKDFLNSAAKEEKLEDWVRFENASRTKYLEDVNADSTALEIRARAYERAGDNSKALDLLERATNSETDAKKSRVHLAKAANIAAKATQAARAQALLTRLQGLPERSSEGLGAEAVGYVREIALPPYANATALSLLLDDMFNGFHAENDIRTLVSLTERLNGSREADILYEKILAVPTRSLAESELKEESLLEYAEVLRNQGRLVKSADMFLAVANLESGKNRAEAAYKAGVVYFRAGLLEKATASWNLAANDLENSKYSALANERLNRIR